MPSPSPTPPAQKKRRSLGTGRIYSELQSDGFWHLGCGCSAYMATSAGNAPWCEHLDEFIKISGDIAESSGFNSSGIEASVYVLLRPAKPYIDMQVDTSGPDSAGNRLARIATSLDEQSMEEFFGLDFSLGYFHNSMGRVALCPLVREWIRENMESLIQVGCRHDAHTKSRFDAADFEKLNQNDPWLWADLCDIACRGVCRVCRELDADMDLPF